MWPRLIARIITSPPGDASAAANSATIVAIITASGALGAAAITGIINLRRGSDVRPGRSSQPGQNSNNDTTIQNDILNRLGDLERVVANHGERLANIEGMAVTRAEQRSEFLDWKKRIERILERIPSVRTAARSKKIDSDEKEEGL